VVDGSPDRCLRFCASDCPHFHTHAVVSLSRNFGSPAIAAGLRGRGQCIAVMAAIFRSLPNWSYSSSGPEQQADRYRFRRAPAAPVALRNRVRHFWYPRKL
jgi:hypothetical protein